MKKMLAVLLVFALCLSVTAWGGKTETFFAARAEENRFPVEVVEKDPLVLPDYYFKPPEDAVVFLADRVKNGDFLSAMGAMAAVPRSESFSLAEYLYLLGAYYPSNANGSLPAEYEAYVPVAAASSFGIGEVAHFAMSLLCPDEEISAGYPEYLNRENGDRRDTWTIPVGDGNMTVAEFVEALDPARLGALRLESIYRCESASLLSQSTVQTNLTQGMINGYTDTVVLVAVYSLEGEQYCHTYTVVKYPAGWKLAALSSAHMLSFSNGSALPMTQEIKDSLNSGEFVPTWLGGDLLEKNLVTGADLADLAGTWVDTSNRARVMRLLPDGSCTVTAFETAPAKWNLDREYIFFGSFGGIHERMLFLYQLNGDRLTLYGDNVSYTFEKE